MSLFLNNKEADLIRDKFCKLCKNKTAKSILLSSNNEWILTCIDKRLTWDETKEGYVYWNKAQILLLILGLYYSNPSNIKYIVSALKTYIITPQEADYFSEKNQKEIRALISSEYYFLINKIYEKFAKKIM